MLLKNLDYFKHNHFTVNYVIWRKYVYLTNKIKFIIRVCVPRKKKLKLINIFFLKIQFRYHNIFLSLIFCIIRESQTFSVKLHFVKMLFINHNFNSSNSHVIKKYVLLLNLLLALFTYVNNSVPYSLMDSLCPVCHLLNK